MGNRDAITDGIGRISEKIYRVHQNRYLVSIAFPSAVNRSFAIELDGSGIKLFWAMRATHQVYVYILPTEM